MHVGVHIYACVCVCFYVYAACIEYILALAGAMSTPHPSKPPEPLQHVAVDEAGLLWVKQSLVEQLEGDKLQVIPFPR